MASFLRTIAAILAGALATLLWVERQTSSKPTPRPEPAPTPPPDQSPQPEQVVEQIAVPDPEQAARIEALEAELAEQRAIRAPEPSEAHPGVDAIRAARLRALELERELARGRDDSSLRWFQIDPPSADDLIDAAVEHLSNVALWISPDSLDASELWPVLGAMQEFAEASGGAWFEFDGEFARWCAESGHPHALDPDQPGVDKQRPTFKVAPKVNRSGQQVVPTYVNVGEKKLYWVDDVAGETGRMHVVGVVEG